MVDVIRAKFKHTSVLNHSWNPNARELRFEAQYDNTIEEDKRFYDATPSGSFRMLVNNPTALEFFKLGEDYYFDITRVPPKENNS